MDVLREPLRRPCNSNCAVLFTSVVPVLCGCSEMDFATRYTTISDGASAIVGIIFKN
jgi:hypothetical protein